MLLIALLLSVGCATKKQEVKQEPPPARDYSEYKQKIKEDFEFFLKRGKEIWNSSN